jgi:pimeloyl-ACP methyl ester carboxylesterase
MLKAKYPDVPIVAHSTPVGRAVELARSSFHEWNQALGRLPGISGFSQYGWTEFAGQPRLQTQRGGSTAQTPAEAWRQYDEFVRTFPSRQIAAYQKDWGEDKKMYLTQWGTHADRNTAVQGLHIANFYFFLAQYNAAHDDYFPVATSSVNLAQDVSKHAREGGTLYREKIELLTPYLYTKPFRHLFSGDKKLLDATVPGVEKKGNEEVVKALAAVGTDGRKYVYLLNSGPAVAVGRLSVDGATLPAGLRVEVESVWGDPAFTSGDGTARGASAPAKTFTGEKNLRGVVLEPFCLTLLIIPNDAQQKAAPSVKDGANRAVAPVKEPAQFDAPAKGSPEEQPAADTPADKKQRPKKAAEQKEYDKDAGPRPDLEDVAYGPHERLKLDLWKAKSDQPTPVLVFFHGGGGDKLMFRGSPLLKFCLSNGISAAAVNYRPNHEFPFPVPMQDAGRAVQFLRSKASEFNIDPKRVAAFGTSLGANVSISLAYNGDLADPKSDDPVLRESSRLCFVITADAGGGFAGRVGHPPAAAEMNAESGRTGGESRETSATYHITKDDPPILMTYTMPLKDIALLKNTPPRELIHNPAFGLLLKRKLDAAGVENYLYHGGNKAPTEAEQQFILKHFFPRKQEPTR